MHLIQRPSFPQANQHLPTSVPTAKTLANKVALTHLNIFGHLIALHFHPTEIIVTLPAEKYYALI